MHTKHNNHKECNFRYTAQENYRTPCKKKKKWNKVVNQLEIRTLHMQRSNNL